MITITITIKESAGLTEGGDIIPAEQEQMSIAWKEKPSPDCSEMEHFVAKLLQVYSESFEEVRNWHRIRDDARKALRMLERHDSEGEEWKQ
jgi:hypothetical protein